jgi:hypothetical protein
MLYLLYYINSTLLEKRATIRTNKSDYAFVNFNNPFKKQNPRASDPGILT